MERNHEDHKQNKKQANICGKWIKYVRTGKYGKTHPKISQEELIARLQTRGLNMKRSSLSRIETGTRALTDIEVIYFSEALKVPIAFLYEGDTHQLPKTEDFISMVADD